MAFARLRFLFQTISSISSLRKFFRVQIIKCYLLYYLLVSLHFFHFSFPHSQMKRKHSRFLLHNMFPIFVRTQPVHSAQRKKPKQQQKKNTRKEWGKNKIYFILFAFCDQHSLFGLWRIYSHSSFWSCCRRRCCCYCGCCSWCCCLLSFLRLYCPLMCDHFLLLSHCHIAIIIIIAIVGRSRFNGAQYTVDRIQEYHKSGKMHKIYFLLFSGVGGHCGTVACARKPTHAWDVPRS